MVEALILKLNGWPKTFNERIEALAASVDELVVVRPKPTARAGRISELENVVVYDLPPERGSFVEPGWLKPIVFPVHVLLAVLVLMYLWLRGELPSVIHALDYALGGLAGAVVSSIFSRSLAVSVRGLKEPRYKALAEQERTLRASVNYRILRAMTNFVLTNADHVVTKSSYQVDFVKETFDVDPGFTTVPTGVDFEEFDPAATSDASSLDSVLPEMEDGFATGDDVVLYLAKLLPEKGPDKVLEHVATLGNELPADVKFAFVGEFRDTAFKRRFRELRDEVPDKIILYPNRIPFKDVPALLGVADATVLLSEPGTEGVPRILQESCAMQTPIVASEVTGIAGAFEELPGCYLVDRDDPQEFISAVTEAVTDSPKMPRELFSDRFDIYQNYAKYVGVYEELSRTNS